MNTPLSAAPAARTEKDDPTIWRVDDALWALLEPILRVAKPRKKPGRPRRDDRAICDGLIWLARTGSQWPQLPRAFGPQATVHERFSEGVETDARERAWAALLRADAAERGLAWSWLATDGCLVKAPFGKKGCRARRKPRAATPPTGATPAAPATS
jgi:putative transposase